MSTQIRSNITTFSSMIISGKSTVLGGHCSSIPFRCPSGDRHKNRLGSQHSASNCHLMFPAKYGIDVSQWHKLVIRGENIRISGTGLDPHLTGSVFSNHIHTPGPEIHHRSLCAPSSHLSGLTAQAASHVHISTYQNWRSINRGSRPRY